jgi:hypothetical protein
MNHFIVLLLLLFSQTVANSVFFSGERELVDLAMEIYNCGSPKDLLSRLEKDKGREFLNIMKGIVLNKCKNHKMSYLFLNFCNFRQKSQDPYGIFKAN